MNFDVNFTADRCLNIAATAKATSNQFMRRGPSNGSRLTPNQIHLVITYLREQTEYLINVESQRTMETVRSARFLYDDVLLMTKVDLLEKDCQKLTYELSSRGFSVMWYHDSIEIIWG